MTLKEWFESLPDVGPDSEADGWVGAVHRGLGMRDTLEWTEDTTAGVKKVQREAGLPETGVVSGVTWALLQPEVKVGEVGDSVRMLRKVYELEGFSAKFDEDMAGALGVNGVLDRAGWAMLVGLTYAPEEVEDTAVIEPESQMEVVEVVPEPEPFVETQDHELETVAEKRERGLDSDAE